MPDLDSRSESILKCVVDFYLETGEAVGSRALTQKYRIELSPATIRNIMSDLEEIGLLYSEHASSGRIPTTDVINMFLSDISRLLHSGSDEIRDIENACQQSAAIPDVLEEAIDALSQATGSVGIAFFPKTDSVVAHVEIKGVAQNRYVLLIILDDGNIESKIFTFENSIPEKILRAANTYLNKALIGEKFDNISKRISDILIESNALVDGDIISLVQRAFEDGYKNNVSHYFIVRGKENLFNDIENMNQLNKAKQIMHFDETKDLFFETVNDIVSKSKESIFLGEDTYMNGCSLIISPCISEKGDIVGAIGITSPIKKNYKKVIPIVDSAAKIVARLH